MKQVKANDLQLTTSREFRDHPATGPPARLRSFTAASSRRSSRILLYSAEEWEAFILEWVHCQKTRYAKVVRMSGAMDMGIDVAGFIDDADFKGV